MLHVSRYTQGCELVAMFDDVTDSGNVTFVCDDGGQTDARKWSRELTSPARGVHTPALLPSTVVSASHCPAQISLYSEDACLPSSSIPCNPGRWLSSAFHLSVKMAALVSRLWPDQYYIYLHRLYLCSHGDKPTFARLLLWAVTTPSIFGPWWALNL